MEHDRRALNFPECFAGLQNCCQPGGQVDSVCLAVFGQVDLQHFVISMNVKVEMKTGLLTSLHVLTTENNNNNNNNKSSV